MEFGHHPGYTKILYMENSVEYLLQVADLRRCLKLTPIK